MLNDRSERKKLSLSRHRKVTKKYSINYRMFHILLYTLPPTWYEKLPASPAIYLGLIFSFTHSLLDENSLSDALTHF